MNLEVQVDSLTAQLMEQLESGSVVVMVRHRLENGNWDVLVSRQGDKYTCYGMMKEFTIREEERFRTSEWKKS